MSELPPTSISEHFATLTDPRRDHLKAHRLVDILTITLCAVICGADDWVEVETFGQAKEEWLRTFLELGAYDKAPGSARGHARNVLAEWRLAAFEEKVTLIVSELVTNSMAATRKVASTRWGTLLVFAMK